MDKLFNSDKNPLLSILMTAMMSDGEELLERENIINLYQEMYNYLSIVLKNPEDVDYLDFDCASDLKVDYLDIKPKNLTTALWFCGIFPDNCEIVENWGKYRYLGKEYSFDSKTKKLKIRKL